MENLEEKLNRKRKLYRNGAVIGAVSMILGAASIIYSARFLYRDASEIATKHYQAKQVLENLEHDNEILSRDIEFPSKFIYTNPEIQAYLEEISEANNKQKELLEKAIASTKNYVFEIEKKPEFIKYQKVTKEGERKILRTLYGGGGLMIAGIVFGMSCAAREEHHKKKLKDITEKLEKPIE